MSYAVVITYTVFGFCWNSYVIRDPACSYVDPPALQGRLETLNRPPVAGLSPVFFSTQTLLGRPTCASPELSS
jgi:hypothetical protein